ncbi:MAG: septum formation initiator family protein [Bacillota bacterium]
MEFFGVLYFCLVILAGGILVWQPARVAQMNEQITRLDAELQDLRMQSESLKKTVSAIESLGYVEKEAKTRLGMVSPQEVRTFSLSENANESLEIASLPKEEVKTGGIFSLFGRIAQIFGAREATAKGQR